MPREIERRILCTTVEARAAAEGGTVTFTGYAALYDTLSEDLGGFKEIIRAGAFDRALKAGQDILVRCEHDSRLLLGRTSNGTARVFADAKGLRYEVDVPDTQAGRDTAVLIKRGDVRQSSFAFSIPDPTAGQRWTVSDGEVLRELLDVDIHDCAPVAGPAYTSTSVSARALEQAKEVPMKEQKRAAYERFSSARKAEFREAPFEDKIEAVWSALYDLLGYPWSETGSNWRIEATYPDRVVVWKAPGRYDSYPLAFDATNGVTIGTPAAVEMQFVPVTDGSEARKDPEPPPAPAPEPTPAERSVPLDTLRRRNDLAGRG